MAEQEERGSDSLAERFRRCFDGLATIGRDPVTGGYHRFAWTEADAAARRWFEQEASARGLTVERDRNANQWAWWGARNGRTIVTGSHLDTVPGGGACDGSLGVVSGLLAVEELARVGRQPRAAVAVVNFADEEGARFGTPTFGSGLLTGALKPADVLERRDADGVRLADALEQAGVDPNELGPDSERLRDVGGVIELHVEQGRGLVHRGAPVGLCSGIWPHGRWRLTVFGEANHAGTTPLEDRRDPMLTLAGAIHAARRHARDLGAVATIGRVLVAPNGANSVPGVATGWLDARAADDATLDRLVERWKADVDAAAACEGSEAEIVCESRSAAVRFDSALRARLRRHLQRNGFPAVELPTAAGHDAGVLAEVVPAAMLFVRNRTGVSHSPAERADLDDCVRGIRVLAAVLEELTCSK